MKRRTIIFLVVLFSPFTFFGQITHVSGISFTSTSFWFYIDEPGVIDYPEMIFTVKNNYNYPVEIVCTYEKIEGIDIEVYFDWVRVNISAGESVSNHYSINVAGELSAFFILQIYLREKSIGVSDSQLASGGGIVNKIFYYSDIEGSLLDLKITDQANTPRESTVIIKYSKNDSMTFSPIKQFNGTSFYGVLPFGDYFVQAWDSKTNIYAEKYFNLSSTNETIHLKLELVAFKRFKLEPRGVLGINTTIKNSVDGIQRVKIYAELYQDDEIVSITPEVVFAPFLKTDNQEVVLWFEPIIWNKGQYQVRGVIEADGLVIAIKWSPSFNISSSTNNSSTVSLETVLLVAVVIVFASYLAYIEYRKRKMRVVINEKH